MLGVRWAETPTWIKFYKYIICYSILKKLIEPHFKSLTPFKESKNLELSSVKSAPERFT